MLTVKIVPNETNAPHASPLDADLCCPSLENER